MRSFTTLLTLSVAPAAPLVAEAGRGRSVGRMPVQPQAYKKPQTVTPEDPAVVEGPARAPGETQDQPRRHRAQGNAHQGADHRGLSVPDGRRRRLNKPTPATVQKLSADLASMMSRRELKSTLDTQALAKNLKTRDEQRLCDGRRLPRGRTQQPGAAQSRRNRRPRRGHRQRPQGDRRPGGGSRTSRDDPRERRFAGAGFTTAPK